MPDPTDDTLEVDLDIPGTENGDDTMPADATNLEIALTAMANGASAASSRRVDRADQLSGDSQASWTIAMQSPTFNMATAQRVVTEGGSGRTRAETNNPGNTAAPGGSP